MNWEELTAISTFVTMIVIAASAVAAAIQLRHMRASNAITGFLGFMDKWDSPEARARSNFIFNGELDAKLADSGYRASLDSPFVDTLAHPEIQFMDFWESLGGMLKMGYVGEEAIMESGGPAAIRAWNKLMPVVAIIRRRRGPQAYDNFEYLASRAMLWEARHPEGVFPKHTPHLPVVDPFPEEFGK